jgi:hypothetical protein
MGIVVLWGLSEFDRSALREDESIGCVRGLQVEVEQSP